MVARLAPRRSGREALPLLNYDAHFGFGIGARAGLQRGGWSLAAQAFGTTRGKQEHELSFDVRGVVDPALRATGSATFKRRLPPAALQVATGTLWDVLELSATLSRPLLGPLKAAVSYQLAVGRAGAQSPWVRYGRLTARLELDTRDDEVAPSRGGRLWAAVGTAHPFLLSAAEGWQLDVGVAGFLPVTSRFVVAGRLVYAALWGAPPQFALLTVGGHNTVRGLEYGADAGRRRMLATVELRARVIEGTVLSQALALGLAAFVDSGAVLDDAAGRVLPVARVGAGAGVRLAWNRAFVVRLDVAAASWAAPRLYLEFGHVF
ncbi:MAG: BamA/TamA family outer membrane protein [Archangiaceae bacterium]|nr:BamA/TamA family outer membrane protein [Archangiaceae bacterium]